MNRIFRIAVLLLSFSIDINLKAEAVFLPKKCWGNRTPCAVENASPSPITLNLKGMNLKLDKAAVVKTSSESEATLARGTLFAKHEDDFRWHTPFGEILCHRCEVLLQREERSVEIHALKGEVSVVRKGDDGKYDLPVGFSVLLSAVGIDGRGDLDFPQASPLRPVAKAWAKVYQGNPEDFKEELKEYIATWRTSVEIASGLHRKEVDRQIASAEDEKRQQQQARLARQREDEKLRLLFRQKNNLE